MNSIFDSLTKYMFLTSIASIVFSIAGLFFMYWLFTKLFAKEINLVQKSIDNKIDEDDDY